MDPREVRWGLGTLKVVHSSRTTTATFIICHFDCPLRCHCPAPTTRLHLNPFVESPFSVYNVVSVVYYCKIAAWHWSIDFSSHAVSHKDYEFPFVIKVFIQMSAQPKVVPWPQAQGKKPFRLASIRDPHPRPFPQAPPAKKRQPDRIQVCSVPTCQSRDLDEENGHLVCQACGTVLQETNIVSDQTFIDGPGGEALRAGVTVGNDSARPRNYDAMAARIVGGMSSREVSEANGKKTKSSGTGMLYLL